MLTVGWFGFNVMSAQTIDKISGLVAVNSLMAMVGGTLVALAMGKNDPGFVYNGPLAGLVAVCAGSDLMHPLGALVVGGVAGAIFVDVHADAEQMEDRRRAGRVAAARPVRRLGRHRGRHLRQQALGGLGGVSCGRLIAHGLASAGWAVYGALKKTVGLGVDLGPLRPCRQTGRSPARRSSPCGPPATGAKG
jgi:Amt family ammonium transporter